MLSCVFLFLKSKSAYKLSAGWPIIFAMPRVLFPPLLLTALDHQCKTFDHRQLDCDEIINELNEVIQHSSRS